MKASHSDSILKLFDHCQEIQFAEGLTYYSKALRKLLCHYRGRVNLIILQHNLSDDFFHTMLFMP